MAREWNRGYSVGDAVRDLREEHEQLRSDFRGHETGPGHGSADLLERIKRLESIVLSVGGAVILLEAGILGTLAKVLLHI